MSSAARASARLSPDLADLAHRDLRQPGEHPALGARSACGAAGAAGSLDADEVRVQRLPAVVDLHRHVGAVLGQPLRDPARLARARALTLDQGDELVVVVQQLAEQPAGGLGHRRRPRPRPRRATGPSSRRRGWGPPARWRRAPPGSPRRPPPGAPTPPWRRVVRGARLGVVLEQRREPLHDPARGHDAHRLGGQLAHLHGHGTDVVVVGQQHHLVGGRPTRRPRGSAPSTGSSTGRRPRGSARPGSGRSGRCPRRWPPPPRRCAAVARCRRRRCAGTPAPSRTQRSSSIWSARSVTLMSRGRPASRAASIERADVVGVDVAVPQPFAAHHDDGVAEPGPHLFERPHGVVGRLEEVHDLVAQVVAAPGLLAPDPACGQGVGDGRVRRGADRAGPAAGAGRR